MLETHAIEMTPEAATKVRELQEGDPKRALLRLYVMGRTCCSYQYGLAFDAAPDEADTVRDVAGVRVAIDRVSAPYCDGARIEWVDGPEGTGFLVRNPTLGGACSCNG
jgi:iron-sulfur cluster insertion protein